MTIPTTTGNNKPASHKKKEIAHHVDSWTVAEWDRLISSFNDASYDQTATLSGGIWGRKKLSHLAVTLNDEVIAAAQIVIMTPPLLKRGIAYLKFGPLWRQKDHPVDISRLKIIIDTLKQEYVERRRLMLTILPPPDPVFGIDAQRLISQAGFCIDHEMTDPNRYLVDLSLSQDQQLASLGHKWRYNLKKALTHEMEITLHEGTEGLRKFMPLYKIMLTRKRFNDTSGIVELPDLVEKLPQEIRPQFVLAYSGEEVVAGAVIGNIGETTYYLFGATGNNTSSLMAGYSLQWWIINHLGAQGTKWYDLGGEAHNQGLRQFKRGLVGKRGNIQRFSGEFSYCIDPISRLISSGANSIRAIRHQLRSYRQ